MLEIKVPAVGESISEVTVGKYYKREGDAVKMDEVIAEFESDKATFELNAPSDGVIKRFYANEGDAIAVGATICDFDVNARSESNITASEIEPVSTATVSKPEIKINATDKSNVIPKTVTTSKPTPTAKSETTFDRQVSLNDNQLKYRGVRMERMSSLRKTISKRLVAVKNETAMLTTFNEVDMKPIMDLRSKYKDMFKEKHGVGLGFMSFFTRACCEALLSFPNVNAQLENDNIIYHDYCDISVAVSTEKGLVVPVLRNAQQMSLSEIEKEIIQIAGKARDGKLTIEEMTGGTFTITNGGVFGSMLSTPIINAPQSAILGMHNIVERAVVKDGQIVIRPIMYVALSYDHRLIDGKESVGFLVKVKQILENPERLLLEI